MISMKKALAVLAFGAGLSYALVAHAEPDAQVCANFAAYCEQGDQHACSQYIYWDCRRFEGWTEG